MEQCLWYQATHKKNIAFRFKVFGSQVPSTPCRLMGCPLICRWRPRVVTTHPRQPAKWAAR
jgi:hypothetical protein